MEMVTLPISGKEQLSVLEKHNFQNIIFSCNSTKILSEIKRSDFELYKTIMNSKNLIQITGGNYGAFSRFLRNNIAYNFEENKSTVTYLQKFGKTIYQVDDVEKIIEIYENIEQGIDKDWSDIQKVIYYYSQLQEYITSYNKKGGNYRSNDNGTINSNNDSLLALVDNTGVCDAISTVFHEAMQRIDIESRFIESKDHAWNIVTIRDENNLKKSIPLAIDLTWDVCVNERNGKKSFMYFGFMSDLKGNQSHIPLNVDDIILYKMCKELSREYKKEVFSSTQEISQENSQN